MTRARTVDVLNDSTTLQSRIDTVLAAPDLDWSNDSGWQPGDPLYEHPWNHGDYTRRMFEIIYDPERGMRCDACQVSWSGPEACWVCGDPATARTLHFLAPGTVIFDETHEWSAHTSESMRSFVEQMNAASQQMAEAYRRAAERIFVSFDDSRASDHTALTWALADPEPITEESRQTWAHANARCLLLPELGDPAAPTVAELEQAVDLTPCIEFPADVEITPVAPIPMPETVTSALREGRRRPESRRYYFDRPVTETRRNR